MNDLFALVEAYRALDPLCRELDSSTCEYSDLREGAIELLNARFEVLRAIQRIAKKAGRGGSK